LALGAPTSRDVPMDLKPPKKIGRYEIRAELGRGMMGVVYEADDPVLGRTLALKTIELGFVVAEEERKAFELRFLSEARAAARLSHPGIVVVYDAGADPDTGQFFMALEYLHGRTLDSVIKPEQPHDWREALRITGKVAEALHHAHGHGIIHRDIKPANIMLLESGEPKIMDFGIAKLPTSQLTATGQIFGSPAYMSPERAREEPVDARSDVFSLGAVLYELVTGTRPFAARDVATILMRVAHDDPQAPSRLNPQLPADVDRVVSRALAKVPAKRYPDAQTLAEDLDDILQGRAPHHLGPATLPTVPPEPPADATIARPKPWSGADTAPGQLRPSLTLPEGKRVSIAILEGPRQGEIFTLAEPRALIGRAGGGAGALVEIDDPEISRSHAVLECEGKRILLRDLRSTNGTFVNEARIDEAELEDRSEFRVGRTRLMLILADLE
jgi:serine/threonine-protein kinase